MTMPGRKFSDGSSYRYSINGQEKSDELNENLTTAMYWEYDSRIGRRWNVDPELQTWESPYLCFNGNPILKSDILGNKASGQKDWVKGKDGKIKWDPKAKSPTTTKKDEEYLGKTITFVFNSYIDVNLWDGPGGSGAAGDKLTSTISITGVDNAKGTLTDIKATKSIKIGKTPVGTGRDYYPGLGKDQNIFSYNETKGKDGTIQNYNLNFEQHASVSKIEEFGLNALDYNIVNVAQKLTINFTKGILTPATYTDVFPSATLKMGSIQIMYYPQPSFVKTHSVGSEYSPSYLKANWYPRIIQ